MNISLRFRATDNLSPTVWAPKSVVKDARVRVVKIFGKSALTSRRSGTWHTVKWRPRAKSAYRYNVCFKDLAGNPQSKAGSAKVVVR